MTDTNHSRFLNHLKESESTVWTIAEWLNGKGYNVTIPASSAAPTHGEWKSHADNGDLYINQRIEIKHLGVSFSTKSTWPFGKKFIVCAKHSFDRATPKPFAYIIVSNDKKAMAIVMVTSCAYWAIESKKDSRYNSVDQEFYLCPLEHVKFFKLEQGGTNDEIMK